MTRHDHKEIEGFRVSYLLPDGKPLKHKGGLLEGVEVEIAEGPQDVLSLHVKGDEDSSLSRNMCDWEPTYNWGGAVSLATANESVIAVLDYYKLGGVGKPAREWLAIEGFDPMWLEGARFEGREGRLVRDRLRPSHQAVGWDSSADPGDSHAWSVDVLDPWHGGTFLYLTPENEAKALALPGVSGEEWRERREEGLGTSEIEGDDQHELLVQKTVTEWMNEEHFSPWMLEGARFPASTGREAELVLHSSNHYLGGPAAWSARRVSTGEWADWREVEALFSPHLTGEASNAVCIRKTNYHALLRAQGKMPWVS